MVRKRKKAKSKKALNINKVVLLVLLIFILGIGGTIWFFASYKVVWNDYLEILVKVPSSKSNLGFNADPTLCFGKIPSGSHGWKETTVWNDKDFPVRVEVSIRGEVAPWISVKEPVFTLQPNTSKTFKFWASVPSDFEVPEGMDYVPVTGKARIRHLRI